MKNLIVTLLSVALVLTLSACGPKAKITSSWADPSFAGYGADNVLVMGVSRNETHIKLFENVFVDELQKSAIEAMASYKVIGSVLEPDRKTVEAAVAKTGATSVLITHVVDRTSTTQDFPGTVHFIPGGFYGNMYGYYNQTYSAIYNPPSSVTRTTVHLESNLYDVATAKLVWSAQSDAIDPKLLRTDFERIVDVLIADMKNKKALKR
jgi:hypothetical protein